MKRDSFTSVTYKGTVYLILTEHLKTIEVGKLCGAVNLLGLSYFAMRIDSNEVIKNKLHKDNLLGMLSSRVITLEDL